MRALLVGFALLIRSFQASADVLQENFGVGVLGVEWRASVSEVMKKFPNGSVFPNGFHDQGRVGYRATADTDVMALDTTDQEVQFSFDVQDRLRVVRLYFEFSRSQIVLRSVTEALGKHSRMVSNFRTTTYFWLPAEKDAASNPPFTPAVALTIGNALPYEWVVLYISDESVLWQDR